MRNRIYQREEKKKKKTPHSSNSTDSGVLQGRPFTMQLKTLSQQPDLKTSLSRAERYGHHLDTIQCAGLSNVTPIQMSVDEDEEKLTSGMDLDISMLSKKSVLDKVLSFASLTSSHKNHQKGKNINIEPKKHFAEKTIDKEERETKQNLDEHLKSQATNNSENKVTDENSRTNDQEVTRLLNKQTQNNSVSLSGTKEESQDKKLISPPYTYEEKKSTPTPKVGTRGQYINKREAMNIIGDNKEFAATQRAVKKVPVKDTTKFNSKAKDSQLQVKLKNAAELIRDQVVNEDRQVKEYIQAKLNLDPAIIAQQGGEQLILQKMQN